jgi:hypothetical protein
LPLDLSPRSCYDSIEQMFYSVETLERGQPRTRRADFRPFQRLL